MKKQLLFILFFTVLSVIPEQGWSKNVQLVAGAGPSTKVAQLFFEHFSNNPACQDYSFPVMGKSVKHKGGILSSDNYLFGRTGRPLTPEEKSLGKAEIILGQVPISFVTGLESGVKQLSFEQLKAIFTRQTTNWSEVGGNDASILLIGREQTEALFLALKQKYPFFAETDFDQVFDRDGHVIKFLQSHAGAYAISFGAKPNFTDYNLLEIKGFSSGVPVGLVYDLKNREHPVVKAAIAYAQSEAWQKLLSRIDMLPAN